MASSQLEKSETSVSEPRAKMIKLLGALHELDAAYTEKRDVILAEMDTLLHGGDGIGVKLNTVIRCWCETWQERHHEPFDFDKTMRRMHTPFLKEKIHAGGVELVSAKMVNFILGPEKAAADARHPFGWFRRCYPTIKGLPTFVADHSASATSDKLRGLRGE